MVKRTLILVFVLFLTGAIINLAVAWACAGLVLPTQNMNGTPAKYESGDARAQGWRVYRWEEFGTTRITAGNDRERPLDHPPIDEVLPYWSNFEVMATATGDAAVGLIHPAKDSVPERPVVPLGIAEDARGWPMRSLRCWWNCGLSTEALSEKEKLHSGILLEPYVPQRPKTYSIDEQRAFPLKPIWLGFVANSMFYASVLFALGGTMTWLRRAFRRARGGCPKCGYPVGTSPVCTECGSAIPLAMLARIQASSKAE